MTDALNQKDFSAYYQQADRLRRENVGDTVHLRAIVEFSNYCRCGCGYCGLRAGNRNVVRYRMEPSEIIDSVLQAHAVGYKTIVMQSGEDPYFTAEKLGRIITDIKSRCDIVITLSCGEMPCEDYAYLKQCGAGRYLLKHETADRKIYHDLHPGTNLETRIACLKNLKKLGYETGSGFMIGLPGQTMQTIVQDILLLKEIGCDMAGIGPFLPHPHTPLWDLPSGSAEMTKRAVALTRIVLPKINLPATTALGVLDMDQKNDIFSCGANVIMRKVTPDKYKKHYEIYPSNMDKTDIADERRQLEQMICAWGKTPL